MLGKEERLSGGTAASVWGASNEAIAASLAATKVNLSADRWPGNRQARMTDKSHNRPACSIRIGRAAYFVVLPPCCC